MPQRSTAICRSFKRCRIVPMAARVTCGLIPRSISLAPTSRITASVPSGTDQSSRARASEAVSPETPALITSAAGPFPARAACSRGTKAIPRRSATLQTAACTTWRNVSPPPYDLPRGDGAGRLVKDMHDTLGHPSGGAAIALRGVNLSLGGGATRVHILRDIDLNIGSGEAVALLGPSGSGKSTLLMVMTGLERADSGSIVVAGEDLGKLDEDTLARFRGKNIGIVFQAFHLIPTMTALENVAVPLELAGVDDAFARAERELIAVGLGGRLSHYPAQLSGGEQQR